MEYAKLADVLYEAVDDCRFNIDQKGSRPREIEEGMQKALKAYEEMKNNKT